MADTPTNTPENTQENTPSADAARNLSTAPQAVKRSLPMALSISLGILLAVLLYWLAYQLVWLILLLYLSFVVATILCAPVNWLESRFLPRAPATVSVMAAILLALAALSYFLMTYFTTQFDTVAHDFQQLPERANAWLTHIESRWPAIGQLLQHRDITSQLQSALPSFGAVALFSMQTFEIVTALVLVFFIVLYMVIEGPDHLKSVRRLFPKHARLEITNVVEDMARAHRLWFIATLTNMASSATLTATALWIVGIQGALVLGLIAGMGELVPNIGPLISNLPVLLFTLIVAPQKFWVVLLAILIVQTIQGYGISPIMMKRSVRLPVLATILSVIVMGTLFQVLGVIVAIPLTADLVLLWNYFNHQIADPVDADTVNPAPTRRWRIGWKKSSPPLTSTRL